jgi:hypothetical protein
MEIQRASSFGFLAMQLGIKPVSRITYRIEEDGFIVWDLETATAYRIRQGDPNPQVRSFVIPENIKQIIAASDEELKERLKQSWLAGWSDERETIFTELNYRGISTLGL